MPSTPCKITVDPSGTTLSVTLKTNAGATAVAYTTQDGSTTVTFPQSISALTTYYIAIPGIYSVSAKLGGQEIAGRSGSEYSADLSQGSALVIRPSVDEVEAVQFIGGAELAYAESTTGTNPTFTTTADLTGVTVTFTVTSRPVYVEACLPYSQIGAGGTAINMIIADAANTIIRTTGETVVASATLNDVRLEERINTPGTYTRKIRVSGTGGTVTVFNSATTPPYIKAVAA